MVLKRADADIIAEEPIAPPGGGFQGPYVSPSTVLDIPWSLIDQLRISLGGGGLFSQPINDPSWRISQVAEQPAAPQEAALPTPGDRRDQAPVQSELPEVVARDWFEYWELRNQGIAVSPPETYEEPIVTEDDNVGLLGDIYDVVDASLGGVLPGGVAPQLPTGWGGPIYQQAEASAPLPVPQAGGGMVPPPPPSVGALSCTPDDPYKGYVLKRYCGQWRWIKQKHRRRKQLFTQRDATQLSSLMGIAGKDTAVTKTWIASHPS